MTCSRAFLTNFEVFHLVMKHNVICLMLLKQNNFKRRVSKGWKNEQLFYLVYTRSLNINLIPLYFVYELLMYLRKLFPEYRLLIGRHFNLPRVIFTEYNKIIKILFSRSVHVLDLHTLDISILWALNPKRLVYVRTAKLNRKQDCRLLLKE